MQTLSSIHFFILLESQSSEELCFLFCAVDLERPLPDVTQMLSEEIGTDQVQKLNEVSMQSEHN